MRGPLLLLIKPMDNFNDWDLQAVVRSCSSFAHADDPAARHAVPSTEAGPEPPAPAPLDEAVQERRVPARTAPPVTGRAPGAAVVKQEASSSRLYGLDYLDLDHKPFLLPPSTSTTTMATGDDVREVMISFPAASTSGAQSRAAAPGRNKAGARTPRPKRSKKSQLKKVVREMPVADGGVSSSDPWAWRKYGQKPIKGSPYPRGYYKCSSMKGCMARKLVERSPAKTGVLIVTYMAEHCHPVPTQLNALAGTTRHTKSASAAAGEDHHPAASSSPRSHDHQGPASDVEPARCDAVDSNEASTAPVVAADQCGGAAGLVADDEAEFWPAEMDLDELFANVDEDFDLEPVVDAGGSPCSSSSQVLPHQDN